MPNFDRKDFSYFLGKQFIFTYDNGWSYELYIKNEEIIDYRIHKGINDGDRWIKNQVAHIARIAKEICKVSWTEPTGTNVSLIINLQDNFYQATIFFPRWILNHPERLKGYQNDRIPLIEFYREAGPTYPIEILDEFAQITFIKDRGLNNEEVIACAANELPADFPHNLELKV